MNALINQIVMNNIRVWLREAMGGAELTCQFRLTNLNSKIIWDKFINIFTLISKM